MPVSLRLRGLAAIAWAMAPLPGVAAAPAQGAPADAPCTWHVRLLYRYHDAGPQGAHDADVTLALDTPMRCRGSGAATVLTPDGPATVRGGAHRTGSAPHAGGATGLVDTYDKAARWPAPDDAGAPPARSEGPAPSYVGAGFGTMVAIAAPLAGVEQRGVVALRPEVPGATPAAAGTAPYAALDPPGPTDRLDLVLYFDPLPGPPADPLGELAQVPQRTREALAALGGEAALALKGHLFGATTTYNADGAFSICYRRDLALAPARLAVDYCGWLTRPGLDWAPARLPPVDAAPGN